MISLLLMGLTPAPSFPLPPPPPFWDHKFFCKIFADDGKKSEITGSIEAHAIPFNLIEIEVSVNSSNKRYPEINKFRYNATREYYYSRPIAVKMNVKNEIYTYEFSRVVNDEESGTYAVVSVRSYSEGKREGAYLATGICNIHKKASEL